MIQPAIAIPAMLMTSWVSDPASSLQRANTSDSAASPEAGMVVTEMKTPINQPD
ncbi:MAG: hypothetical protein Q8L05_01880 [Actinomycetota bacterium]|nr:hypothetical protein [Actinomycetota bacterium]